MNVSDAHVGWLAEQSYEWRRWAVAFVQLKRTTDQFVDGVLDRQMFYATVEAIENALCAMLDIKPETLSIIIGVLSKANDELESNTAWQKLKHQWPTD